MVSISSRTTLRDLQHRAVPEEQKGINSGGQLPDVTGAHQELVAGDLGIRRGLAKGRDKKLGPTMHEFQQLPLRVEESFILPDSIACIRPNLAPHHLPNTEDLPMYHYDPATALEELTTTPSCPTPFICAI